MGGNAIKNAQRLSKTEYQKVCNTIQTWFNTEELYRSINKQHRTSFPLSYREKSSFGDLDCLTTIDYGDFSARLNELQKQGVLRLTEAKNHAFGIQIKDMETGGWSPIYQLDHMYVEPEHYDFTYNYMCWNDLGNFIGRIARYYGLKFSTKGLFREVLLDQFGNVSYSSRFKNQQNNKGINATQVKQDVLISNDWDKVLTVLGLKPATYHASFDNLYDIAQFVFASPYFDMNMFKWDNVNSNVRCRDKSRPNYQVVIDHFEELLKQNPKEPQTLTMTDVFKAFPDFPIRWRQNVKSLKTMMQVKRRLNMKRAMAILTELNVSFADQYKHVSLEAPFVHSDGMFVLPTSHRKLVREYLAEQGFDSAEHYQTVHNRSLSFMTRKELTQQQKAVLQEFVSQFKAEFD